MRNAGFDVSTAIVDVSSRDSVHALVETATSHGEITGVIHAAGLTQPGPADSDSRRRTDRPRGEGYRRMLDLSPVGRGGTPDEVGTVGALLMGPDGAFITGSDFLMDGGVTASYFYGDLAPG